MMSRDPYSGYDMLHGETDLAKTLGPAVLGGDCGTFWAFRSFNSADAAVAGYCIPARARQY